MQPGLPQLYTTKSDREGRFELEVPKDKLSQSALIGKSADGSQQAFCILGQTYDLSKPELAVRVILKPARRFEVRTTDSMGRPIGDAQVGVISNQTEIDRGTSNFNGEVVFQIPADAHLENVYALRSGCGIDFLGWPKQREQLSNLTTPLIMKLDGAQSIRIKAIDSEGKPISGLKVVPLRFNVPRSAFCFPLAAIPRLEQATDDEGLAIFDWIPLDSHWPSNKEYVVFFEVASVDDDWTFGKLSISLTEHGVVTPLRMQRTVPVRGKVAFEDGRPASDVEVATDDPYFTFEDESITFSTHRTKTDREGRFELRLCHTEFTKSVWSINVGLWRRAPK